MIKKIFIDDNKHVIYAGVTKDNLCFIECGLLDNEIYNGYVTLDKYHLQEFIEELQIILNGIKKNAEGKK